MYNLCPLGKNLKLVSQVGQRKKFGKRGRLKIFLNEKNAHLINSMKSREVRMSRFDDPKKIKMYY